MMVACQNHLTLHMDSNSFMDSSMRLVSGSSSTVRSYSERAATKRTALTDSKQCNHFLLSDLWPPKTRKFGKENISVKWGYYLVQVPICVLVFM